MRVLRTSVVVLMAALVAGCYGRYTPRRPQPLSISRQDGGALLSSPCAVSASRGQPSGQTPAVTATGALSLVDVRGDDRLAVAGSYAVAWPADNKLLLMATATHVLAWQPETGVLARNIPIREPLDRVHRLVISADGQWLAVSGTRKPANKSSDKPSVILLNLTNGEQRLLSGVGGRLAFSPDGRQLFGGGFHWDIAEARSRRDKAIGVNRQDLLDGQRFVTFVRTGKGSKQLYVPELRTAGGDVLLRRFEPVRFPGGVGVSADGQRIAIISDHILRVYSTSTFEQLAVIGDTHSADLVSLSQDGRRIVLETVTCIQPAALHVPTKSVCPDPMMSVWDLNGDAGPKELWRSASGSGDQWVFSRDGSVLTGPDTRLVESLRRADSGDTLQFGKRIRSISPDGHWVLFEGDSGLELAALNGEEAPWQRVFRPKLVVLSPQGTHRVTAFGGTLRLEGNDTCTELGRAGFANEGVRFSADGALLVAIGRDAEGTTARAIDSHTGAARWTLRFGGAGGHNARTFVAGRRLLVQGSDHDEVLQFDLVSGQQRRSAGVPRLSYHTPSFGGATYEVRDVEGDRVSHLALPALSRDGGRVANVAFFDNNRWISVWDLNEPARVVDQPAQGWPSHIVPSPTGSTWAIGYRDGRVRWLTQDGSRWTDGEASHGAAVTALRFTPSGHRLVSAGRDGSVLLFDPSTGAAIGRAVLPLDHVTHLALSGSEVIAETARRLQVRWRFTTPSPAARAGI